MSKEENKKNINEKLIYKDIFNAQDMIGKIHQFGADYTEIFSKLYPFTTENINGYISQLDLNNKDILTVGSSGDQVLASILYGCKSVTCMDINPYVKYYFALKKAAIKSLTPQEFLDYFCYLDYKRFESNDNVLNYKTYQKISSYLDKYSKMFWDNLYLEFNGEEIRKNLLCMDEDLVRVIKHTVPYLNEDDYYKLREIIDNVNPIFITQDIKESLKGKYDYIFLSNIAKYLRYMFESDCLINFKDIITKMENNINDDGKILMAYLYNTDYYCDKYQKEWADIYNLKEVYRIMPDTEKISFKGVYGYKFNCEDTDLVLVHEKKLVK